MDHLQKYCDNLFNKHVNKRKNHLSLNFFLCKGGWNIYTNLQSCTFSVKMSFHIFMWILLQKFLNLELGILSWFSSAASANLSTWNGTFSTAYFKAFSKQLFLSKIMAYNNCIIWWSPSTAKFLLINLGDIHCNLLCFLQENFESPVMVTFLLINCFQITWLIGY